MATWTNETRTGQAVGFLQKEDGDYILLESGDRIILDQSTGWTNTSPNATSWTNETTS